MEVFEVSTGTRAGRVACTVLLVLAVASCDQARTEAEAQQAEMCETCDPLPPDDEDDDTSEDPSSSPALSCYRDADGDGYSGGTATAYRDECPAGWSEWSGDCDDGDADIYPRTCYSDGDGDGYGEPGTAKTTCGTSCPAGTVANGTDCDDDNRRKYRQLNCYYDSDSDGHGGPTRKSSVCTNSASQCSTGTVENSGDCDDADKNVYFVGTCYSDKDGDGYKVPARACRGDTSCVAPYSATPSSVADCDDVVALTNAPRDCEWGTGQCVANCLRKFAGVYQTTYQTDGATNKPWKTTLDYADDVVKGFTNSFQPTSSLAFLTNLAGGEIKFESEDYRYTDAVDLFFGSTHGYAGSDAGYAMYEVGRYANTSVMRLGDGVDTTQRSIGRGLSILSMYACDSLRSEDGGLPGRWQHTMKGGLRVVTAGWGLLWLGWPTAEAGTYYGNGLQAGMSIKSSWHYALENWYDDNAAAIMATGSSSSDCANRRDGMTWNSYGAYSRLRDDRVTYYCWTDWMNEKEIETSGQDAP